MRLLQAPQPSGIDLERLSGDLGLSAWSGALVRYARDKTNMEALPTTTWNRDILGTLKTVL